MEIDLNKQASMEGGAIFFRKPLRRTSVSSQKKMLLTEASKDLERTDLPYMYASLVADEIMMAKKAKKSSDKLAYLNAARSNVDMALTEEGNQPLGQMNTNFVTAEEVTKSQIDANMARIFAGLKAPALGSTYKAAQVGPAVKVNRLVNDIRVVNGEKPYAKPALSQKFGKLI